MAPKTLLLLLALAAGRQAASCQQLAKPALSKTQRQLLRQLARYGRVEGPRIGRAPVPSAQYARFDSLRRLSTPQQLLYFATLRSPAVKLYAYGELLRQNRLPEAFSLMQANLRNAKPVESQSGCITFTGTVNWLMYRKLRLAAAKAAGLITDSQQAQLDAMLQELPAEDND